jgi:predicted acetyltransferase
MRRLLAADKRELRLTRRPDPAAGRLRDASPGQVRKELQQVYERVRVTRPGWSGRDENWWTWRLSDPASSRHGYTQRRALLFDGPDRVDGYALWRRKAGGDETGPKGEVNVVELVAATPAAYLALWDFLLSVDLARTVQYRFAAADEPLRYLVDEPRALAEKAADSLWVRVVDVPGALSARRYAAPVDVVLEVSDALIPANAGRWRLTGDANGAVCAPATDPPELACDVAELGALYLGGTELGALAAAGRVRELRPGAVAAAAAAFGWRLRPSALDTF